MAIARDYLEPTETKDACETKLIDHVLEGWGKWAQRGNVHLQPTAVGYIWRIPDLLTERHELVLSDEKFQVIDRHVAALPSKQRTVVFIEYYRNDEEATSERNAARAGLKRFHYRQTLTSAHWNLFGSLRNYLDLWRQKSI
jgi:hypothetical protein